MSLAPPAALEQPNPVTEQPCGQPSYLHLRVLSLYHLICAQGEEQQEAGTVVGPGLKHGPPPSCRRHRPGWGWRCSPPPHGAPAAVASCRRAGPGPGAPTAPRGGGRAIRSVPRAPLHHGCPQIANRSPPSRFSSSTAVKWGRTASISKHLKEVFVGRVTAIAMCCRRCAGSDRAPRAAGPHITLTATVAAGPPGRSGIRPAQILPFS